MFALLSLHASMHSAGTQCSLNDAAFVQLAADTWEHTLSYTTIEGNAYILWASALLLHLLHSYSLSSDLISNILTAFEQTLKEAGGEMDITLTASVHMADSLSGPRKQQAYVIILPSGLPAELRQTTPEHFLVADSGATVHCLWDSICTAYLTEQNSSINWGGTPRKN